jgi:hypothetical protein
MLHRALDLRNIYKVLARKSGEKTQLGRIILKFILKEWDG